jgi:hypothetical protein
VIVNLDVNETIDVSGAVVTNQQGQTANGTEVTHTTFTTTAQEDVDITQDLTHVVQANYNDLANPVSESSLVMAEIRGYATKIQCTSFQGKGTIDDYSELFVAASKIANETKQIQLAIDISGFNEFGTAADELSNLFQSFIVRLQSINIIDDMGFLRSVAAALKKIANLADVFGKFKETILATATVEMPKSAHDARLVVEGVMSQVNCAMSYIGHFVTPSIPAPPSADLSDVEKNIIDKAVSTIEHWGVLSEQGVSVAMTNNPDIIYMKAASADLALKAGNIRTNVNALRTKLETYKNL